MSAEQFVPSSSCPCASPTPRLKPGWQSAPRRTCDTLIHLKPSHDLEISTEAKATMSQCPYLTLQHFCF
eukprot:4712129-Amphidinium_carterae.1